MADISTARLLIDGPGDGAWNMAVDEALLESAAGGVTTLRFYQWQEPTLSLGYFQSALQRAEHVASRDCRMVRRSTGGGAIIHDRELTYSFAMPLHRQPKERGDKLYYAFHETLVEVLIERGWKAALCAGERLSQIVQPAPFLCFERRAAGDVILGEGKVCGSAQRRHKTGLLQHGSVLLGASRCAPELPGIGDISGKEMTALELARAWLPRVEKRIQIRFEGSELTDAERAAAQSLRELKFEGNSWTFRR